MRVTKKYDQHRRDLHIDLECEGCGTTDTDSSAYDDRNYCDNVVPSFKCPKCGESSNSLGSPKDIIGTKYSEGFQI